MKLSVFGLGYVGAVSAACLARNGHDVIGVDPNDNKVSLVNRGISPIVEKELEEMIARYVVEGRLRATGDFRDAVENSELSLVCVGTPSLLNGRLDLTAVRRVCEQVGAALREKPGFHSVVIRSSLLPGSMARVVIPTLENASGKQVGMGFGVCNHPEFLREGSAVWDYFHPPKIIIGETDTRAGDVLVSLYEKFDVPITRTGLETAEMVKYADNTWHALKVAFANEIGNVCKALDIDGREVMDIFCQDTKLNLSPYYLKPGFAFGGSCLPKDVRALTYKARSLDLDLPVINSILVSNASQIRKGIKMVIEQGKTKVGILGFAFKAGTDDLRESPMVELIEYLLGKGYELKLYDQHVNLAALTGANRDYVLNHVPHLCRLMVDTVAEVLDFADTVVIGTGAAEFRDVPERLSRGQAVIDLVRIADLRSGGQYNGICW